MRNATYEEMCENYSTLTEMYSFVDPSAHSIRMHSNLLLVGACRAATKDINLGISKNLWEHQGY